ncbi:DMT family transporter [Sphingomonas sp.]|uniref:DMT family transporter n=1 Tax=Sphingomonas sp. TaxID=28214 RepID=UPI0035C7E3FC
MPLTGRMHEAPSPKYPFHLQSTPALAFAALLLGNVALAFGPWFVRMTDAGPVAAGFWRIALATPLLLLLAGVSGGRPIASAKGLWPVLLGSGLLFAGDLAAWHIGIHKTVLANATLFGNSATFIYPLWGFLIARTWPTRTQGSAMLLALAGAVLLMGRSYQLDPRHLGGDLLCLLAGVLYAGYFIMMARARRQMAPLPALAWSSAAAAPPLLLAAWALGEQIMPTSFAPLVALALLSQVVGQGLLIYAIGRLPALIVGLTLLTQPVIAATIGWLAYGERLGAADVIGALMIAVALVLVRRDGGRDRKPA